MSNYFKTNSLGAVTCGGADPNDYEWQNGRCRNKRTGVFYSGDQKQSNCQCLFGNAPSRTGAAFDFLKSQLLPGQSTIPGGGGQPSSSFTSSGLLVPAIAVVGGVALLLILTKKK